MALVIRKTVFSKNAYFMKSVKTHHQHVSSMHRKLPATAVAGMKKNVATQRVQPLSNWPRMIKRMTPVVVKTRYSRRAPMLSKSTSCPNLISKKTFQDADFLPRTKSTGDIFQLSCEHKLQNTFFDCCPVFRTPCAMPRVRHYATDVKSTNLKEKSATLSTPVAPKQNADKKVDPGVVQTRAKSEKKEEACGRDLDTRAADALQACTACCGCCGCGPCGCGCCGPCGCGCGPCGCGCCGCGPCGCGCCGPCGCGCGPCGCGCCGCGCGPCGCCGCGPCGCGCGPCGCGCGPCGCGCCGCGCGCCGCGIGPCGCGPFSPYAPCGCGFYIPSPIAPGGPCGPVARGPCP